MISGKNNSVNTAKQRLFTFMQRYHNRAKLENNEDMLLMYDIHNELLPQNKEYPDKGCQACKTKILKKLQYLYTIYNSNTFE